MTHPYFYDSLPTSCEDPGLANGIRTFSTIPSLTPPEYISTSENLLNTLEEPPVDAHFPATAYNSPGQDSERESRVSDFDPGQYPRFLSAFVGPNPQEGNGFPHSIIPQHLPAPFSVDEPISQDFLAQNGSMTDVFYPENQHPPQGPGYNPNAYNGGVQWSPGPEPTYQPHPSITQPQVHFDNAWETPTHLREGDEVEGSLSHPAGIDENPSTALVPASSSQAEANLLRNRSRNQGKQRPTPYERGRGGKNGGNRGKNSQESRSMEYIPADSSKPLGRPDFQAVHQTKYYCKSTQRNRKVLPPIEFTERGCEGIRLTDAMNMKYSHLDGRDDPMFVEGGAGPSVSLRIDFMGHKSGIEKAKQIPTMNHQRNRVPITRQKLGHDVAKFIKAHLEEGDKFHISFEDMYLVRLHRVSHASCQPEVWCRTPAASQSDP